MRWFVGLYIISETTTTRVAAWGSGIASLEPKWYLCLNCAWGPEECGADRNEGLSLRIGVYGICVCGPLIKWVCPPVEWGCVLKICVEYLRMSWWVLCLITSTTLNNWKVCWNEELRLKRGVEEGTNILLRADQIVSATVYCAINCAKQKNALGKFHWKRRSFFINIF